MKNKLDKFLSISGFNAIFIIIRTITLMILLWLATRYLGPEKFGEYSYCVIVVEILILFTSLGISNTIPRYFAEFASQGNLQEAKAVLSMVFRLKLILMAIVCFSFLMIHESLPGASSFHLSNEIVWLIIFTVLIGSIEDVFQNMVDGLLQNRFKLYVYSISAILRISLIYFLISRYPTVSFMLRIGVLFSFSTSLVYFIYNRKFVSFDLTLKISRENAQRVKNAIGYQSLTAILLFIIWQRSELFFLKHYSSSLELGLYSFAFSLTSRLVRFVPSFFIGVLIPFLSHLESRDDLNMTYYYLSKYMIIIGFYIATCAFVITALAVNSIWGADYKNAIILCQIMLFSTAIAQISNIGGAVMQRLDKQKVNFFISLIVAITDIVLSLWLIPKYHALGAAAANSITQILLMVLILVYFTFILWRKFPWRCLLSLSLLSGFFVIFYARVGGDILNNVSIWISIIHHSGFLISYSLCFLLVVKLTNVLDETDTKILERIASKLPGLPTSWIRRLSRFIVPNRFQNETPEFTRR